MAATQELQFMDKTPHHSELEAPTKAQRDAAVLARLGKKSVLEVGATSTTLEKLAKWCKRRFGFISICGFTCTILVTWEGSLILFTTGLTNGGSAGLVYGYLFVWLGTIAVFTTMAELASMAPTAGGQYHWISQLAPPPVRKFMSYIIGWLVICGWMGILAGGGYLCGVQIEALIQLSHPSYDPQQWQGTLLFWATVTIAVLFNTVLGKLLPSIEALMLVIHVLGFFAILIPMVYMVPKKASPREVFTVFSNAGGWPTQGLSFFVGLIGTVFAMFIKRSTHKRSLRCDAAVHMSEEVSNADVTVPWSMLLTTLLNGAFGFGIVIAVLFVTPNIDEVLESPTGTLGFPYMQIFYQSVGNKGGANAMITIILLMTVCGTIAALATASRLIWAFARDRGLPFSRHVSKVQVGSSIPIYAVIIASSVACLIGLINLGSAAAFNDVISLSVSSLYASYIFTEGFLFYRRVTGSIRSRSDLDDSFEPGQLLWGPFHLPGVSGIAVNGFALVFGCIIFFFSFWPVATPVVPQSMNFSSLMTGGVVLFAVLYYVLYAKMEYKGPVVEVVPYGDEQASWSSRVENAGKTA